MSEITFVSCGYLMTATISNYSDGDKGSRDCPPEFPSVEFSRLEVMGEDFLPVWDLLSERYQAQIELDAIAAIQEARHASYVD